MVASTSATTDRRSELPESGVLRWLYERMVLIRTFEERIAVLRSSGGLQGSAHLYAGQEAVAVGVCARLNHDDYVASTHRGHGHAIAKGVDVKRMMAELYGRSTGTNRGKGGSMHIADTSVGMLGAKTYRYYGHFLGDDPLRYRTAEEEAYYRGRDCIQRFEETMRSTEGQTKRNGAAA